MFDVAIRMRHLAANETERHPLLPKYLRLRREWQGADPRSGRHRRLAQELAQLERAFVDMGVTPFADTQPCEQVGEIEPS
jgi:hypothetical protein